jgi:hypothetical protein
MCSSRRSTAYHMVSWIFRTYVIRFKTTMVMVSSSSLIYSMADSITVTTCSCKYKQQQATCLIWISWDVHGVSNSSQSYIFMFNINIKQVSSTNTMAWYNEHQANINQSTKQT